MKGLVMRTRIAESTIVDRGRGPEIAGTRITVYDVMDYLKHGWHRNRIAALFRLSSRDIKAAIDYIEQHHEEVAAAYESILQRHRDFRYPPEVQAKVDRCREAAARRLETIRRHRSNGNPDAQNHG